MQSLDTVLQQALAEYDRYQTEPYIVRPSLPVAYFGDSESYARSPIKIVTAALNPSFHEFPTEEPYRRFPKARDIMSSPQMTVARRVELLRQALDAYFVTKPYRDWFDASYSSVLRGLDASFRYSNRSGTPSHPNTAIHTDFLSPLATKEGWGDFSKNNRAAAKLLAGTGTPLWHQLIEVLQPDIVLLSIGDTHLSSLAFSSPNQSGKFDAITGRLVESFREKWPEYILTARWVRTGESKNTLVLSGLAGRKPFLAVRDEYKMKVGAVARSIFEAGPRNDWPVLEF